MSNYEKLRERIKKSLENAISTVELKDKIKKDIIEVVNIIGDLTNDEITPVVNENFPTNARFPQCDYLIFLQKKSVNYQYGFNIIGYAINDASGYPVILETETDVFDCGNESEMKEIIANVIDQKSIKIIKLLNEEVRDIPF